MAIAYVKGDKEEVQGSREEIYKKYGKEWKIRPLGGGNGNWLLTKKSDVLVDGKSYREFVLDYYHKTRLTKTLYNQFLKDLENGKVKLP